MQLSFQNYLVNQTLLLSAMQQVTHYLKGFTLIYHDDKDVADIVTKSILPDTPVLVYEIPELPDCERRLNNTILISSNAVPSLQVLRSLYLWWAQDRLVIILYPGTDVLERLQQVWEITRSAHVLVVVVGPETQFFTWYPYQAKECNQVKTLSRLNPSNLFPDKTLSSINGCPITTVFTPLHPTVFSETKGIESAIFVELISAIQGTPSYEYLPPPHTVWEMVDNQGQPLQGMKLLYENKIDMIYGNLIAVEFLMNVAEFLPGHTGDCSMFYVPSPKVASHATAIYRAFQRAVWISTASSCLLIFLILFLSSYVVSANFGVFSPSPLLDTLALLLGQPLGRSASFTINIMQIMGYMFSLHLITAYQASFINYLSDVPREKAIESWEDLADSPLKIIFHNAMKEFNAGARKSSDLYASLTDPKRTEYIAEGISASLVNENRAVAGNRIGVGYQLLDRKYYDEFDDLTVKPILPVIYEYILCLMIGKGHFLAPLMKRIMLYMVEAGLTVHIGKPFTLKRTAHKQTLQSFGIDNVIGPFILLGVSLTLCILSWIGEWIVYFMTSRDKTHNARRPVLHQERFSQRIWRLTT